jgi:hypothetical protein
MKLYFAVRPWENEPDNAEWTDDAGYKCRIVRNMNSGTLCGYVGIPRGHALWGRPYSDLLSEHALDIDVHGGLTYDGARGDLNDNAWYFGFDTSHADDFAPKIVEHLIESGDTTLLTYYDCMKYRTWEFAEGEVAKLSMYLRKCEQGVITNVS